MNQQGFNPTTSNTHELLVDLKRKMAQQSF